MGLRESRWLCPSAACGQHDGWGHMLRKQGLPQSRIPQQVTPWLLPPKIFSSIIRTCKPYRHQPITPLMRHLPHTCVPAGMSAAKFPSTNSRYPLDPSGQVVSATWCHAPSERLVLEDQP